MPGEKSILEGIKSFSLPEFNKVEGELKAVRSDISRVEGTLKAEISNVRVELKALSEKVDLVRDMEKLKLRVQE
ncbi:MAG: hypothetical protein KIS30_08750 [Thermoplasmata archaeon]|nr:hypothetical protein [Candidatus Sysuiplasma acidicola]